MSRGKPKPRKRALLKKKREAEQAAVPARPAESLLTEVLPELAGERVLCTSLGRGQLARAAAARWPESSVTCHFLDVHLASEARDLQPDGPAVEWVCSADLPEGEFDLVLLPFSRKGEAELSRELLQSAHQRLRDGGRMAVAVDNPKDEFFHDELRKMFDKVTRRPQRTGVVYLATKRGPLKRPRDFTCEFAYRDGERLVRAFTRPGVFSHRRLDQGARALLESVAVEAGDRVLDIGCGAGGVGVALALREENVSVLGIDSNARALSCAEHAAGLNEVTTFTSRLTATGELDDPGTFDLVVANPPYFSNFAIAGIFVETARRAVKPGGCVAFVTRQPDWFAEAMVEHFDDVAVADVRTYFVVAATGR